ncbi:dimethylglycine demethylation protein DgcB [soil metagenome]
MTSLSAGNDWGGYIPALVLIAALAILLTRVAKLMSRWRLGGPASVPFLANLVHLPRRYLHDVHHIVAREPRSARMHASLAGTFIAALVLSVLLHAFGIGGRLVGAVILLLLPVMAFGIVLQAMRRLPLKPARFSGGPFYTLTAAFILSLVFFGLAAFPRAIWSHSFENPAALGLLAATGLAGLGWLAWSAVEGPMRHALAGAVYLTAHPRPDRFEGNLSSDLKLLDMDKDRLGISGISDFAWNRLASFDACIQCGRCEAVCPAFAAGLPLNPKKLINDLANAMSRAGAALAYHGSAHPGVAVATIAAGPSVPLVRAAADDTVSHIDPDTLWACTTCRACVYECPMTIEHVDAIVDLRRFETLEKGATIGKGADALENLRLTDTCGGHDVHSRLDWAVDLKIPLLSQTGSTEILLWLGESAFDLRGQRSLRALVRLLKRAQVNFAVLGHEERDTGDLARRLGDEATFQRLAKDNIACLSRYEFSRIVTTDPHAMHSLRNEYPSLGGIWMVQHHTQYLEELLAQGRLAISRPAAQRVTYHDPCYLGRYNGELAAPRKVLALAGADLIEMARSGMRSSCCGGGGGAPLTDVAGKRRIPDVRMDHVRETGATRVIAACPFCTQMLEGVASAHSEVSDIAEFLLEAVEGQS